MSGTRKDGILLTDESGAAVPVVIQSAEVFANVTAVGDGVVEVTILAANPLRQSAIIFNASTSFLLIKFGTNIAAGYTVSLAANTSFTVTAGYRGIIRGVWSADTAGGFAAVTELTLAP